MIESVEEHAHENGHGASDRIGLLHVRRLAYGGKSRKPGEIGNEIPFGIP